VVQGSADFVRFVLQPAMLEVNGLSDVGVALAPVRRSKFAPIEAVTITWWKKEDDEYLAAMRERDQSKIGRMARLRGAVETVKPQVMRPSAEG
jgi:hypothetical protein